MMILSLAFRNIFRNFRRSLLTFIAVSFGLVIMIISIGVNEGFEKQAIGISVDTNTGLLRVYHPGYLDVKEELSLDSTLTGLPDKINKIKQIAGTGLVEPRIIFPATLSMYDTQDELMAVGIGVVPETEDRIFNRSEDIVSGSYIKPGEMKIVLGQTLANLLKLEPGNMVTVITRTKYGTISVYDYEVAGIISTDNPEVDNFNFFLPLQTAEELLEMDGQASEILVGGPDRERAETIKAEIKNDPSLGRRAVESWLDMTKDLRHMMAIRRRARGLISLIIILMAATGIVNTMLMAVFERIREIGTLMAMGFKERQVLLLFISEGFWIGIFGSVIGCLIGGLIIYRFATVGLDMASFGVNTEQMGSIPVASTVYSAFSFGILFTSFLIGVGVSVLAAIYPAFKASRLVPAEALRKH